MAVNLSPVFGVAAQLFDDNGNPLAGGKIFTYLAGTTTNAPTYTSSTGAIAHSNPIILDGAGRVPSGEIWLTDGITYKFVVQDVANNLIGTYDNLTGINSNFVAFTNQQEIQTATAGQTVFNLATMQYQPGTNSLSVFVDGVNQYGPGAQYAYIETDSDTVTFISGLHVGALVKFTTSQLNSSGSADAAQISYLAPYPGAVATNVEAKLSEYVSVLDFGADPTGAVDSTAAIQAALNAFTNGGQLLFPPGTYLVSGSGYLLQPQSNTALVGTRDASIIKLDSASADTSIFGIGTNVSGLVFEGLSFDGNSGTVNAYDTFGLQFPDVGDITVNNCAFDNFTRDGMLLGLTVKVDHLTVNTCNFSNIGYDGVRTYNARMQYINNSRFFGFTKSPLDFNPILVENLETTTIVTNNYFSNDSLNWTPGFSTLSLMSDRNYVAGNTIVGGGMIVVHPGPFGRTGIKDYRIIGNSIQDTVAPGIIVNTDVNTDIVVSNNYIRNAERSGIVVLNGNPPPYSSDTPVIVSNNIIQDTNNSTYTNTNQPACILVAQTSNVIVTGNQCITPRWAGIAVLSGANNCTIQGNTVIGQRGQAPTDFLTNAGGGIVVATGGVSYTEDVSNITISGNFVYNFLTTLITPTTNIRTGGIVAYSDGGKILEYITIANNVVRNGNGIAIQTYFIENSTIDGNIIWNSNGDIVDTSSTTLLSNAVIGQYTAAPTTGTWTRGTVIYNSTPSSAGFVGWVCTASGTPGTWKTFGLIS
jgi:hypothetical protein